MAEDSPRPGPAPEPDPGSGQAPAEPAGSTPGSLSGPELARAVLEAAQARRRTGRPRRTGGRGGAGRDTPATTRRTWSGPGPDPRDPQPFGALLGKLVRDRGWQRPTAEATVFGQWADVVGSDVADHCRPVKLERGELTLEAESTAWATQLRLLASSLLRQIAAAVGHNVVTKLHIHGPAAPSWSRGPRRVRGRGPRDTYG